MRPTAVTMAAILDTSMFRALLPAVVPEAEGLETSGWEEAHRITEEALAQRAPAMRRQLRLFVKVLEWAPLLLRGRRFSALDVAARRRFLAALQDSRLLVLRRGFWGLRTLLLLGYYARDSMGKEIGGRAHPRGWQARQEAGRPGGAGPAGPLTPP